MHLSSLKAEHQAAHSFTLASSQRATVDSARHKRTTKLNELQRIKCSVESRIDSLTSGMVHRAVLSRVKVM